MGIKKLKVLEASMEMGLTDGLLRALAKKFGPEVTRNCAMATSVGGIGPLLRERLIEQAQAGLDAVGVSLLYNSVHTQRKSEHGELALESRKIGDHLRQILQPTDLDFQLTLFDGEKINVRVWLANYGLAKIYFLDCPKITDIVYPGRKDSPRGIENIHLWSHVHRLKQFYLVGRGSLALAKKLDRKPDIAILSETPAFFMHHRVVPDDFQEDPFFNQTKYIYNDHTPLEYAHPLWDQPTLDLLGMNRTFYSGLPAWDSERKLLDITCFLAHVCDAIFGVSKKHLGVMKTMHSLEHYADKLNYITNGVRLTWQASEFSTYEQLSDEELQRIKNSKRNILLDWLWERLERPPDQLKQAKKKKVIMWMRRITPYKRLDLLPAILSVPDLLNRFLSLNILLIVGGRVHQQDQHAQKTVSQLLTQLRHNPLLQEKILFLENFNLWEAPTLFQGADGTLMLSDDNKEASATGFMKAMMNGASVLCSKDGAIPEFVHFSGETAPQHEEASNRTGPQPNGFLIPFQKGEPTPEGLLRALEHFDAVYKNPATVSAMMRSSLSETPEINLARAVQQLKELYRTTLYQPQTIH